jgi:hypothetical protein
LPPSDRGHRILCWVADQAWLAYPANPEAAVRRECRRCAPWLTAAALDELVEATKTSNKRWSHDQSATVLELSMRDSQALSLRFLGCADDPTFERRLKIKRAKNAACKRKSRAAKRSGRRRGRPKSEGIPAWQAAGFGSERSYYRHKAKAAASAQVGSKNASPYKLEETREVTEFHCHPNESPDHPSGAPQAPPHRPIILRLDETLTGKFIDEAGNEFEIPPPHQRPTVPKDWMEAAFAGYRGERS